LGEQAERVQWPVYGISNALKEYRAHHSDWEQCDKGGNSSDGESSQRYENVPIKKAADWIQYHRPKPDERNGKNLDDVMENIIPEPHEGYREEAQEGRQDVLRGVAVRRRTMKVMALNGRITAIVPSFSEVLNRTQKL
jgi:hypothetical protein